MFAHLKSLLVALVLCVSSPVTAQPRLRPVPIDSESNLFIWSDTCNVYVLRDGAAALLIDLGDGGVLDHLGEIGVRRVEWVLFTHHQREQCQGAAKLAAWKPLIAAPEAERALFEEPMRFRKVKPTRGEAYTVHGAADQDTVSKPTSIPDIWQVTKHLYKFKRKDFWPNFAILIADSGHAQVFDCGLIGRDRLARSLTAMQEQLGLQKIDAVLITHMHGDHFLDVPYLREAYVSLSAGEDYRYMFDPYWVRAEPYQVFIKAGQAADVTLHVRNFLSRPQPHRIEAHAPRGVNAEPSLLECFMGPQSSGQFRLKINATAEAKPGVYIVALDVTVDGKRYGEWFDMVVGIEP